MLLAAALLVVTGCKKDNKTENNGEKMIFTATIDNGAKTQINGYDQVWNTGDKVKINGEEFTVTPKAGDPSWATFEGQTVNPDGEGKYKAIFPSSLCNGNVYELPATQTYDGNNLSGVNPLYAESTTQELVFHNICALMKLTLRGNDTDKVTEIKVSADQALSGYFEVKERGEGYFAELVTSGGSADVTLMCGDGVALTEEGTAFYIAIPEYDDYSNLTFTATTSEGKTWTYKANGGENIAIIANNLYESTQTPEFVPAAEYPYLCFTAVDGGTNVILDHGGTRLPSLQTSTDKITWTNYIGMPITLENEDDKVYFRSNGDADWFSTSLEDYVHFTLLGNNIAVSGNIMSLINPTCESTEIPCNYCFCKLFSGCTSLTDASELILPAIDLKEGCYSHMFEGCEMLKTAPELPATNLAPSCYESMFSGCKSLETVPALNATELAVSCYESMFSSCTSLTEAPALNADVLAESCYESMFSGCTYLTEAPALPATTLAPSCYKSMFSDCTKLTAAPGLFAEVLAVSCYESMFFGCESLEIAPELPATELAESCYREMFKDCSKLNYIKVYFTEWGEPTNNWVEGVSEVGTFEFTGELPHEDSDHDYSKIPFGWTVQSF